MSSEFNNLHAEPLAAQTVVACPPMVFLNASLDCFLKEANSIDPICDEIKLRESIDLHYSLPEQDRNESRSLCFNNIIILATTAQLRIAGESAAINGMERELLKSFLSNTTRAFRNLDAFCSPSILSVQALITSTFVAREHFPQSVADALCHRVCNVARTMGLQQSYVLDGTVVEPGGEREAIYWTLYIMDKHRTFLTGYPCNLSLFDSDLNLLNTNRSSRLWKLKLAQIYLMVIWEEIYITLYSQKAMRLPAHQNLHKMTGTLFGLLRNWTSHYGQILGQSLATDPSPASYLQIELKYSFHIAQVLILRHSSIPSSVQLCIDNARAVVMVILGLFRSAFMIGSMSLAARLFRNYPVVAFIKLYSSSFGATTPQLASSLQLLLKCSSVLASVKTTYQSPIAYYNRLYLGLAWYTDNLTIILNAAEPKEPSLAQAALQHPLLF
ncbi:hypothetical protein HYALB_00013758 [Hymenoscyphus albidus]|uniref:Transcription factor domain-containing protein n=1 Tax=Hymenoscyphus albidus TaxID=595503 RepID=A0A9N9LTT0_9HELO|nr:hypothetical protein HYALB_00013758 [Hymenoscyphus albidus]